MSLLAFRLPRAAISATGYATLVLFCLFGLYVHFSNFVTGDHKSLCGNTKWGMSLSNDCFRLGFMWPALRLLYGVMAVFSFALCYVIPASDTSGFTTDGSSPFALLTVGNMNASVRRPPGQTIIIDNRIRIGISVILLQMMQTVLYSVWADTSVNSDSKDYIYSLAMQQLAAVVLILSVVCLAILWRSNPMTYAGLFPSILPAGVGLQFISGTCEIYASFFTDKNSSVPIIGTGASVRSNLLVITTILNMVLLVLYSMVQWRPIFLRSVPSTDTITTTPPYTSLADIGDDASDDETTPLSHMSDQKSSMLVDTPEQNSSLFDRLTFSWLNDILDRGSKDNVNYSDLYKLDSQDAPVANWNRYQANCKPGRTLLTALALTYAPHIFTQFVMTMICCVMRFAGPFFLQRILRYIKHSRDGPSVTNSRTIYLEVFGLFASTLYNVVVYGQLLRIGRRICIGLKGLLVAELMTKTLRRPGKGTSDDKTTSADSKATNAKRGSSSAIGKVMNILTSDFNKVINICSYLDNLYSPPAMAAIGIWYMYNILGVSALIGMVITVLYMPLSKILVTKSKKLREQQSATSDKRIAVITELLQGIKAVKLFGWESRFVDKVDSSYEQQLGFEWRIFLWSTGVNVSASLNPIIILVIMFTSYTVVFGNTLTAEVAFTSVAVFQIVRSAILRLPNQINNGISAYVAIQRIDSYLKQAHVQDLEERTPLHTLGDVLGFDCADLEWSSAEKLNSSNSPVTKKPNNNTESQLAEENTSLLAGTSQTQTTLSVRSSSTDIPDHDEIRRFSLKGIDVRFPLGGLSIVAGPTGSGKSSLLSALVGEMNLVSGRVLIPTIDPGKLAASNEKYRDIIELSREGISIHNIAYIAQESWLRNATIRENILFGEAYDKDRYEEVLNVCALKPDLRILVAGDMTEIGERGVTLSGGQKQRVALARAVYSSRQILLIDDCLSAVDAHTAKHILMECLLSKTALMQGRTCVLVTHHVAMCLPYAQYLVMMHEGQITMKGTPEELKARNGLSTDMVESLNAKDNNDAKDKVAVIDCKSEDEYNREHLIMLAEKKGIDPASDLSVLQGILIKEEEREEGYVKFEVWKTFILACGSKMFWVYLVAILILSDAITALRSYWVKIWVASAGDSLSGTSVLDSSSLALASEDYSVQFPAFMPHVHAVHGDGTMNSSALASHHSSAYWIGIYTLIGLASVAWSSILRYSLFTGRIAMARRMHKQLIRKVVHAVPRFYDSTPVGRVISRFSQDMSIIGSDALISMVSWFGSISSVLAVYFIVSAAIPAFISAAVLITGMLSMIAFYYLKTSREVKRLESNSMSPLLSLFGELTQGVTTIRAFGAKHYYIKEAIACINAHNRPFYIVQMANRWLHLRINAASAFVSSTAALFILFNLDRIDAGMAGFILSSAMTFSENMIWVIRDYSSNEMNMNSVERVLQYLNVEQEAALESKPESKPSALWPQKGDVHIENLVVEYTPGVPVLHGISLSIKHGERVGVVGRTGAGKSTMSLALLRFIEASKGRIVLDGVDISKIGLEDLRRNVTIIPQDPVLFNGTIRFNLDPFDEYPDELLWEALKRTHLVSEHSSQASSSLSSIAEGSGNSDAPRMDRMAGIFKSLEAEIKENGQSLSQGQRQLVSLARALVRRSKLIIMDEATASVDFDTDNRIQHTIRGPEFANSTLICIAHRLRTIIDYDRVLVLDKGKVAEFATPCSLLESEDGIFKSMCKKSGEYEHLIAAASR